MGTTVALELMQRHSARTLQMGAQRAYFHRIRSALHRWSRAAARTGGHRDLTKELEKARASAAAQAAAASDAEARRRADKRTADLHIARARLAVQQRAQLQGQDASHIARGVALVRAAAVASRCRERCLTKRFGRWRARAEAATLFDAVDSLVQAQQQVLDEREEELRVARTHADVRAKMGSENCEVSMKVATHATSRMRMRQGVARQSCMRREARLSRRSAKTAAAARLLISATQWHAVTLGRALASAQARAFRSWRRCMHTARVADDRSKRRLQPGSQCQSQSQSQSQSLSRELQRLRAQHEAARRRMHELEQQNSIYRLQAKLGAYDCVVRANRNPPKTKNCNGADGDAAAGTEFRAHREILATFSGLLGAMCKRSPSQRIFSVPTDGPTLQRLVAYAYSSDPRVLELDLDTSERDMVGDAPLAHSCVAVRLLLAANELEMSSVEQIVCDHIVKQVKNNVPGAAAEALLRRFKHPTTCAAKRLRHELRLRGGHTSRRNAPMRGAIELGVG